MLAFLLLAAAATGGRLITEGGGGDPINPLDVLWRREGTLTANTDSQTQKRTLHAVLCAKPLLPEGTAALVFG